MKALFLSRPAREKILLVLLVLTALVIWAGHLLGKYAAWSDAMSKAGNEAQIQKAWLAQAPAIEARQQKAVANLDAAHTYDGVRLQAEVSTMAANAGLGNATVSPARTTGTQQLSIHTVGVQLRNIGMDGLVTFYRDISGRSPYIGLDRCRIEASRSSPKQLTVSLELSAVQAAANYPRPQTNAPPLPRSLSPFDPLLECGDLSPLSTREPAPASPQPPPLYLP
jgi:hypothetical protein